MNFVYPNILWFLTFIAVPIFIHLFNFRKYKTIYFSDISLLKNVKQETNRQKNIKHLLVLLARILAIAFLVLAFAQPTNLQEKAALSQNLERVVLVVDNSLSMTAKSAKGENLNLAMVSAKKVVNQYPASTQFKILTNTLGKNENIWIGKEQVLLALNEVEPESNSYSAKQFQQIIDQEKKYPKAQVYVFSDFQLPQFTLLQSLKNAQFIQVPIKSLNSNVYIDSVWINAPVSLVGFEQKVFAKVKNLSEVNLEKVSVNLIVNQEVVSFTSTDILANNVAVVTFSFIPKKQGFKQAQVSLKGPQFNFDDQYFFSITVKEKTQVALIYDQEMNDRLQKYYSDSITILTAMPARQVDLSVLQNADLIVLDHLNEISSGLISSIKKLLNGQTNLLIIPSATAHLESYNAALNQFNIPPFLPLHKANVSISEINDADPYFYGTFSKKPTNTNISNIKAYYPTAVNNNQSGYTLLTLNNKDQFAVRYAYKSSIIAVLNAGFEANFGSWGNQAIALPLVYQAAIVKQSQNINSFRNGGQSVVKIQIPDFNNQIPIKVNHNGFEFIPKQTSQNNMVNIYTSENFAAIGHYPLLYITDTVGLLAVNSNKSESNIRFANFDNKNAFLNKQPIELDNNNLSLKENIREALFGKKYWKQCLLLALLFLAIEIGLLRLWKTA